MKIYIFFTSFKINLFLTGNCQLNWITFPVTLNCVPNDPEQTVIKIPYRQVLMVV